MKRSELVALASGAYEAGRREFLAAADTEAMRAHRTKKNLPWEALANDQREAWVEGVRHVLGATRRRSASGVWAASSKSRRPAKVVP